MNLKLIRPSFEYRQQITKMLEEWFATERIEDITPWAITRRDYHDFADYCENLDIREESADRVPDTTLFCYDADQNLCVGAVNIRHKLNDRLLLSGGHIGDGILPSLRGQGYGSVMVALALEECRKLGLQKVLMVCEKDNIASARTIIKNGGVLENEIEDDGYILQRYWITMDDSVS